MADLPAVRRVPGADQAPGTRAGGALAAGLRGARRWAGIVPFTAYIVLGLGLPALAVAVGAFQNNSGGFTFGNVSAVTAIYLKGFESIILRCSPLSCRPSSGC